MQQHGHILQLVLVCWSHSFLSCNTWCKLPPVPAMLNLNRSLKWNSRNVDQHLWWWWSLFWGSSLKTVTIELFFPASTPMVLTLNFCLTYLYFKSPFPSWLGYPDFASGSDLKEEWTWQAGNPHGQGPDILASNVILYLVMQMDWFFPGIFEAFKKFLVLF